MISFLELSHYVLLQPFSLVKHTEVKLNNLLITIFIKLAIVRMQA